MEAEWLGVVRGWTGEGRGKNDEFGGGVGIPGAEHPEIVRVGRRIAASRAGPVAGRVLAAIRREAVFEVPLSDLAFGPRLGEAVLRWNACLETARERKESAN